MLTLSGVVKQVRGGGQNNSQFPPVTVKRADMETTLKDKIAFSVCNSDKNNSRDMFVYNLNIRTTILMRCGQN